ncbi:transposase [Bradyrhizobium liaoningense]|nr:MULTISPECIES: IS21 family transposase [Bradyrhizobium]WLC03739.1 IS21 family transposase [Bradyrhizobium japonicum USDA 123]UQE03276.1 IS21 family transposase [Bradyrhizobium japonicum]UQE03280.1 IS21 family transposase [Bradyrhizobium japonicum]UQE03357.1 IS21 family transposase [Bradyrhizobium japonicum]WLA64692.1 IS21 family transposase [Bradyrhizobium diazoefficiens]
MPAKRELTMRQIRQMLRLARDGVSAREIGRTLGVARSTIQDNLKRALTAGLAWPLAGDLTDAVLEQRLFAHAGVRRGFRRRREPDWASLACELKRPGVNLMVLWEEYRAVHPEGYGYSRFCDLFREFDRRLSPTMRQDHPAGDKVFVDYSGKKIMIVDRETGVVRDAEIFVAVLGASNYTYAEATWTQTLPDWIEAHVRMFRFFGGVPRLVVPDNLKSGVHRASFYDPEINRSYGMMASHYGVGILPARPRKPRDKAKVEAGVRFAQTYILGRLRRQTFFSLAEANAAIAAALERINAHIMRRLGVSRRQLFETVEMSVLASLPDADYQFAEWRVARVSLDYHVEIDGFFYSVPHGLIREQVDVRATTRTIELFHRGSRVAAHQRRYGGRRHGTDPDHMPSAHRRYAEWTPERFRRWGRSIGLNTEGLVLAILANRPHPEQGFRTCLGVLRLFKDLDPERAELIAARAVAVRALTYKSIASIIANKLDRSARPTDDVVVDHPNLRGPGYFH